MIEEQTKLTTVRLPVSLWRDLELIRGACQYRLGERVTFTGLLIRLLEAEVHMFKEENPSAVNWWEEIDLPL